MNLQYENAINFTLLVKTFKILIYYVESKALTMSIGFWRPSLLFCTIN